MLYVGLGAGLGAICRYLAGVFSRKKLLATFIVNIIGSFILGAVSQTLHSPSLSLLIGTGFCGGLTTFSTFNNEIYQTTKTNKYLALSYALATYIISFLCLICGYFIFK